MDAYTQFKKFYILFLIEKIKIHKNSTLNLINFNLTEFPNEMLKLIKLKKLYLNRNAIRKIPEEIYHLEKLNPFGILIHWFRSI